MIPWPAPAIPGLPGKGLPVRIFDTATRTVVATDPDGPARMYVCGITPYDATHIGHAATYVAFDLLNRAWRDAGHAVRYVQNVTDVDDPLLERARLTGVDWRELASQQTDLFIEDMAALSVLPPDVFLGAVDGIPLVVDAADRLIAAGHAYRVPDDESQPDGDVYCSVDADPRFGSIAHLDEAAMLALFAERGGDPDRPGKRHPLDCLLWRVERPDEPAWDGGDLGRGRPGWHIECTTIALQHLGMGFDVQGGGADLAFPHHEMSAAAAHALTGQWPFAKAYCHVGLVGLDGEKMSKSRGNLVFVSRLLAQGVEAPAVRLAILAHHYRRPWEWTQPGLDTAVARLERWRRATALEDGPDVEPVLTRARERLADDLDAPGVIAAVDGWVEEQLESRATDTPTRMPAGRSAPLHGAPHQVRALVDALLGVRL